MANNVVTVKLDGLDDIEKKLYDLPSKFAKRAVRGALKAGAEIWREGLAESAPVRTGWLKAEATISIKLSAKEESGTALVGFARKQDPARHAKHVPSAANEDFWYEFGTATQAPRPFMRGVYDSLKDQVLDRFTSKLKETFMEIFGN